MVTSEGPLTLKSVKEMGNNGIESNSERQWALESDKMCYLSRVPYYQLIELLGITKLCWEVASFSVDNIILLDIGILSPGIILLG